MVWGKEHDAFAADDLGEDQDEGDGGEQQGLGSFAIIAQHTGDDDRYQEVDDGSHDFRAEGVEDFLEHGFDIMLQK